MVQVLERASAVKGDNCKRQTETVRLDTALIAATFFINYDFCLDNFSKQ